MNVLSLFDGMSCGQQALERSGFKVEKYFASEIDKYAIQVTMANYPDTIQLGSVVNVNGNDLPKIDILIGGSPCQSFSFAGKRNGMSTVDEVEILTLEHYLQLKEEGYEFVGQSYLFWEYMRLLNECRDKNPNIYFLLENVEMGEKWEMVLSKAIGLRGIHINSALVSAQNRKRIYWTNIGLQPAGLFGDLESIIQQPKDQGILLKDILENNVIEKYFLSEKMISWLENHAKKKGTEFKKTIGNRISSCLTPSALVKTNLSGDFIIDNSVIIKIDKKGNIKNNQDKASCFTAGGNSGGNHSDMDLIVHNTMPELLTTENINAIGIFNNKRLNKTIEKFKNDLEQGTLIDSYSKGIHKNKSITITTRVNASNCTHIVDNDNLGNDFSGQALASINSRIRRLTPIECERLQTVKDNYTNHVSDSQRYKMIGNGWTVDVISHIFSYLK